MTASAATRRPSLPPGLARWLRPVLVALALAAVIMVLAVSVFPTRTWLAQRRALAETSAELSELDAERSSLEKRIAELDTDEEVESIARTQYGLVKPGEEAYAILPGPERPAELPEVWPFGAPARPPVPEPSPQAAPAG